MNSDDDRYSFVYYSNDVHVVLPSYDEAMQGVRQPPPYNNQENVISAPSGNTNSTGVNHFSFLYPQVSSNQIR